jgi:hypothetical protein
MFADRQMSSSIGAAAFYRWDFYRLDNILRVQHGHEWVRDMTQDAENVLGAILLLLSMGGLLIWQMNGSASEERCSDEQLVHSFTAS